MNALAGPAPNYSRGFTRLSGAVASPGGAKAPGGRRQGVQVAQLQCEKAITFVWMQRVGMRVSRPSCGLSSLGLAADWRHLRSPS